MQPETPAPQAASPETDPSLARADSDLLEPGEELVKVVHRHPIGIVFIYIETLIGVIAILALAMVLAPSFFQDLSGNAYWLFLAAVVFGATLIALILFLATYIYRQCRLLVTDRSLIQVMQRGLFNRKVSRLSMSNVEDVNAETKGFLATIFGYGTLNVETAGEMENFTFPYCPKPNYYADQIIEARQAYARRHSEENT